MKEIKFSTLTRFNKRDLLECIAKQAVTINKLQSENNMLKEAERRRDEWLSRAKRDAGYSTGISFDNVWRDALNALKKQKIGVSPHPEEKR